MNLKNWFAVLAITLVAILITGTAAPRGVQAFDPGGPPPAGGVPTVVTGNWEWVNYGPNGGSYSPQNEINRDNVQFLELKWIFPYTEVEAPFLLGTQRGSGAPPIIVDGVVYVVKNSKSVHAIDAETGEEIWFSDILSHTDFESLVAQYPYWQGSRGHVHALNYYRDTGWLIMSSPSCYLAALNVEDGSLAWEMLPDQLCGTNEELGNPVLAAAEPGQGIGTLGSQGQFPSISNHPPSFLGDIMVWPAMGASGAGGRSSVIGFDMSDPQNPVQLWRTWLTPHANGEPNWAIDQCDLANGNGWYFEFPEFRANGQLAKNCRDVPNEVVMNDWINMVPNTPHYGKVHTASTAAPVWGNMPIDQENGIIYLGTGDIGPYPNASFRYGPNLHGSGIVALDVTTGDLVWWFATNPHDLWDMDCSWGGILGNAGGQQILIKACKNGIVYGLNSATGEPVWVFDPPNIIRATEMNYGVDSNGDPNGPDACCRMTVKDMGKPWIHYPKTTPIRTICYTHCIESDIAYDGEHVYVATHNNPRTLTIRDVRDFGNNGGAVRDAREARNTTLWAIDANTGNPVWSFFLDEMGYRGGMMVSGGVLYAYSEDGNLHMIDTDTGALLAQRFFGVPVSVAPTIGADSSGDHKVFFHIGGGGGFSYARATELEGNLAAFGLPDVLPQPEIIEVVREVPGPVIEVPGPVVEIPGPERIVEVPVEVEVQVISPISYVAIGLGVVLVVIAGVLFTRRRST